MRVITEESGLRVLALDIQDNPDNVDGTLYAVDTPQLHLDLVFCHQVRDVQLTQGLSDEACVRILLDRLQTLFQREPCDAYRRALYHLVKARECFQYQHSPHG